MRTYLITPAAGKRLIGKAMAVHPSVKKVLKKGTLVIVAGTTNGYVAEEIFKSLGQGSGFSRKSFFRGVAVPSGVKTTEMDRLSGQQEFPGDVIIVDGLWQKGKTIFDVVDDLSEGDLILKGANALDLSCRQAAILIEHPKAGTIGAALLAVVGRRVQLILPVGLEKRVFGDLTDLAVRLNAPGGKGPRLLPVPGEVFTELEAIQVFTGARGELIAGGGVGGAEGGVWLAVRGSEEQLEAAELLLKAVSSEPSFEL